jgi:Spy/CpxP family protein refolding chaperone
LALSVVLNLCFVGGALWTYFHAAPPPNFEARMRQMPAELALDPQQKEAFERYAGGVRARIQQMHEAVEPLLGDAWSEIAKPDADAAKIMALFSQAGEKRRGFQRDLTTETLSFLATLSPEQRVKFVEIARRRPHH